MRVSIIIAFAGLLNLLAGCIHQRGAGESAAATSQDLQTVRQTLQASDPKAVVGIVIATLPQNRLAAVGDVPVKDFSVGEPMTFIDVKQRALVNGVIKNITADALHVQYDKPLPQGREPRAGDLAVRFKP